MKAIKCLLIIVSVTLFVKGYSQSNRAIIITGEIAPDIKAKEITISYWNDMIMYLGSKFEEHKTFAMPIRDRKFRIELHPSQSMIYLTFSLKKTGRGENGGGTSIFYPFIGETGDEVHLKIDSLYDADTSYGFTFSGKDAAKYTCPYELSLARSSTLESWYKDHPTGEGNTDFIAMLADGPREAEDYIVKSQMVVLDNYSDELSPEVYKYYKTEMELYSLRNRVHSLHSLSTFPIKGVEKIAIDKRIESELASIREQIQELIISVGFPIMAKSTYYAEVLTRILDLEAKQKQVPVLSLIRQEKRTVLRDRTMFNYFIVRSNIRMDSDGREDLYRELLPLFSDQYYRTLLIDFYESSMVGAKAYNFALPDPQGETVRLSDFQGKVVFVDFWFVGCGGCGAYYDNVVKEVESQYRDDPDVRFITVCINKDRDFWIKGIKSGLYTSEEIINLYCPDGTNNPIIKQFKVNTYPRPVVIDRSGKVFANSNELKSIEGLTAVIEKAKNTE